MALNREKLDQVIARLRAERDELRVKAHLGSMEAKEEWADLEKKWQGLEAKLAKAKEGLKESSTEVGDGIEVVAEELKSAYHRIRERLGGSE